MRIISGALKGRRLTPVPGKRIRPSSDLLRESVFNILGFKVCEARVLDLYAGTGSLGIEALSRGAATTVFVDNHAASIKILFQNIKTLDLDSRSTVFKRDLPKGLGFLVDAGHLFDLIFMDPPYDQGLAASTLQILDKTTLLSKEICVVVEHSAAEALPEKGDHLIRTDHRRYGKALVSFYESVL